MRGKPGLAPVPRTARPTRRPSYAPLSHAPPPRAQITLWGGASGGRVPQRPGSAGETSPARHAACAAHELKRCIWIPSGFLADPAFRGPWRGQATASSRHAQLRKERAWGRAHARRRPGPTRPCSRRFLFRIERPPAGESRLRCRATGSHGGRSRQKPVSVGVRGTSLAAAFPPGNVPAGQSNGAGPRGARVREARGRRRPHRRHGTDRAVAPLRRVRFGARAHPPRPGPFRRARRRRPHRHHQPPPRGPKAGRLQRERDGRAKRGSAKRERARRAGPLARPADHRRDLTSPAHLAASLRGPHLPRPHLAGVASAANRRRASGIRRWWRRIAACASPSVVIPAASSIGIMWRST